MRLTILTVLALALSQAGCLFAWTTPERVDRRPEGYHVFMPALAVTPDGTVHAVWSEAPPPSYMTGKVMYARKDGDTWTIPVNISRDSGDIREPAVATDTLGNLVVVWGEDGSGLMRYVRQLGDTWSVAKPCFSKRGTIPRVAVDSRGRIHMVFQSGGVWYSHFLPEADSWAMPVEIAASPVYTGWARITVDRFDHLHAVWMDYNTLAIGYGFNDGTGWSQPERLPDPDTTWPSAYPAVAVDTSGRPHVVWEEDFDLRYWVYYSTKAGDTWTTPYRVNDQDGSRPVIATDTMGNVHVAWGWGTGLRYRVRTQAGWQGLVEISDSSSLMPEIARHGAVLSLMWTQTPWSIYYSEHDVTGGCEERRGRGVTDVPSVTMGNSSVLTYTLAEAAPVRVDLYDTVGRLARSYSFGPQRPGKHQLRLDQGCLRPGVYLVHVLAGSRRYVLKAVLFE